jgi:hypothetical protein
MGRPSSYKPEYAEQAGKLCKLGATDKELADFFEVTEQTVNNWKTDFPSFFESLKRGKHEADDRVEHSLYRRALGYSHDAVKIFCSKEGDVTKVEYVEHYPPDTVACIFWLKNRRSDEWRDKIDIAQSGMSRERLTGLLELVERRLDELTPASKQESEDAGRREQAH